MILELDSEAQLAHAAGEVAARWRAQAAGPLVVGLSGALGTGKTTWVRAMLRGLGYGGRVPSPTYTLLESYPLDGLTLVHLDLYRLADGEELEYLGVRDWLQRADVWLLVEWPERAGRLERSLDVCVRFTLTGAVSRRVAFEPRSGAGRRAVEALSQPDSNNTA